MSRNEIPKKFNRWSSFWDMWSLELNKSNLSAVEACLSYPMSLPEIDKIIIGVNNASQLEEIIKISSFKKTLNNFSFMKSDDQMLINPNNWRRI